MTIKAVSALVTRNMMRNEDSVTNCEFGDVCAYFLDNPCGFMPENTGCFGNSVPFGYVASAEAITLNKNSSAPISGVGIS